jgi:hypothetical protein
MNAPVISEAPMDASKQLRISNMVRGYLKLVALQTSVRKAEGERREPMKMG